MRSVAVFLIGIVAAGAAAAQLNVAFKATLEHERACKAKLSDQTANLDLHRELVNECTLDAAVAAGVLPAAVVESCRKEFAALQKAHAGTVRKCAAFMHFGSRMQASERQTYAADVCLARSQLPGYRYHGRTDQCVLDLKTQVQPK
jgi:hypothetical protein